MKEFDRMWIGVTFGVIAPLVLFIIYFLVRDPALHIADQVSRLNESGVLSYYVSLCALANLLLFFLFLRMNAERAARGVLGATILYAFTVVILKIT